MSIPWDELASKEVLVVEEGQTVFAMFSAVRYDPKITGEVEDGVMVSKPGLVFTVSMTFPESKAKEWRLWNKRTLQSIRPIVEMGEMLNRWVKIHRPGKGPRFDYQITLAPKDFTPSMVNLFPGPIL